MMQTNQVGSIVLSCRCACDNIHTRFRGLIIQGTLASNRWALYVMRNRTILRNHADHSVQREKWSQALLLSHSKLTNSSWTRKIFARICSNFFLRKIKIWITCLIAQDTLTGFNIWLIFYNSIKNTSTRARIWAFA